MRRAHRPGTWRTRTIAATGAVLLAITACAGCSPGAASGGVPTGPELLAQAEQHYFDYREVTNGVQAVIHDGPWEVDVAAFGMQPSGAGCPDHSYRFDLTRTTTVDPADQKTLSQAVADHLTAAGYDVEGQDLGSGDARSTDAIVRKQGDFSRLMVTFIANGSVLVTASTKCWPGDRAELSRLAFGGVTLSEGYLPRRESPADPLFFGVTPGEPGFTTTPTT